MPSLYRVEFTRSAERDLDRIPRHLLGQVMNRIEKLASQPRPRGCKKISDPAIYRVRQGDYRVVYQVEDSTRTVTVFKIGHRREIYR